jgi:hypothetical protein
LQCTSCENPEKTNPNLFSFPKQKKSSLPTTQQKLSLSLSISLMNFEQKSFPTSSSSSHIQMHNLITNLKKKKKKKPNPNLFGFPKLKQNLVPKKPEKISLSLSTLS